VRRIFRAAGIDYQQFRALVRAYVWLDYAALFGAYGPAEQRRMAIRLALAWGFMSLLGLGLAGMITIARDPFLAAILLITSTMMWTGLIVIAQPANLAAPDDHDIVGFRPVDSRTLFAVRVTALLMPALETIVMMGWLPVLAFLTRVEGSLTLAIAAAAGMVTASTFGTLGIVAVFGWLIRVIAPEKLTRMLAYAGGMAGVVLSAGVMLGIDHLVDSDGPVPFMTATVPRDWRMMWFPPVWFASYVALVSGSRGSTELAGSLLSIAALAAVGFALRGRLSADYGHRVAELTSLSRPHAAADARTWRLLRNETRAVALLVASHLRYDVRFQLAVASSVAMGALFGVVMSSSWSLPVDPFDAGTGGATAMAPLFALLFVPTQIYQALVVSAAYEASWLFYCTPANRIAIITAARDAIGALVIAPLTLLLTAVYLYAFGHVMHAVALAASLGLMAYGCFQLNVLLAPRLPFSLPMTGDRTRGVPMFTGILVMLLGSPMFVLFQLFAYRGPASTIAAVAGLVALNLGLMSLTQRRLARKLAGQGYSQL
jgi:hypothetical protein